MSRGAGRVRHVRDRDVGDAQLVGVQRHGVGGRRGRDGYFRFAGERGIVGAAEMRMERQVVRLRHRCARQKERFVSAARRRRGGKRKHCQKPHGYAPFALRAGS